MEDVPDLIKITKNKDNKIEVKHDKRAEISAFNAIKSLKYSKKLAAHCNDCQFRIRDEGGLGGCHAYEKDAVCSVRKDIKKFTELYDTRKPDELRQMIDILYKFVFENTIQGLLSDRFRGNVVDKNSIALVNALTSLSKVQNELGRTGDIEVSETQLFSKNNISSIIKKIRIAKTQEEENSKDA